MDDEIVIGIDVKDKSNNKKNNKKKSNTKKNEGKKQKNSKSSKNNKNAKNSKNEKSNNFALKNKIFIFILLIIAVIILLSSSLFNVEDIIIVGNNKISNETIISLSGIELHENMFKFNKLSVIDKLKQEPYIENVKISRKLPNKIEITVEERTPKYSLEYAGSYAYINNQGYILEITNEKLNLPILTGFSTDLSNIKAGERINVEDLKKMDTVIKIYEVANSNGIGNLITKIDISNDKNYSLILETEGKTVYLGDCSNLNTRILTLKSILEASTGKTGEIFLNVDLNSENVYFRPSSN